MDLAWRKLRGKIRILEMQIHSGKQINASSRGGAATVSSFPFQRKKNRTQFLLLPVDHPRPKFCL
jgi:hypothetical protein